MCSKIQLQTGRYINIFKYLPIFRRIAQGRRERMPEKCHMYYIALKHGTKLLYDIYLVLTQAAEKVPVTRDDLVHDFLDLFVRLRHPASAQETCCNECQ